MDGGWGSSQRCRQEVQNCAGNSFVLQGKAGPWDLWEDTLKVRCVLGLETRAGFSSGSLSSSPQPHHSLDPSQRISFSGGFLSCLSPSVLPRVVPWNHQSCLTIVLASLSVVSSSLQPLWLQHARLPCPSPSPAVSPWLCPKLTGRIKAKPQVFPSRPEAPLWTSQHSFQPKHFIYSFLTSAFSARMKFHDDNLCFIHSYPHWLAQGLA